MKKKQKKKNLHIARQNSENPDLARDITDFFGQKQPKTPFFGCHDWLEAFMASYLEHRIIWLNKIYKQANILELSSSTFLGALYQQT